MLLGTGLDTRTTRVPWPASTRIFDVCPEPAVALASLYLAPEHTTTERSKQRLYSPLPLPVPVESGEDVGFKTGVNGEGLSAQEAWTQGFLGNAAEGQLTMTLRSNGYRADCPSIWVFHGLHTLSSKVNAAVHVSYVGIALVTVSHDSIHQRLCICMIKLMLN